MQHLLCDKVVRQKIIVAAIIAALPQFAIAADVNSASQTSAEAVTDSTKNNAENQLDTLPEVKVTSKGVQPEQPSEKTKSYTVKSTASATRLDTSLRETPQSISVITREQLDDFRILSVNDALSYATGIKVEAFETDRTEYTARGFNITSFQVDGLNSLISFSGTNYGDLDVAVYDRIEVLRGANGLLAGTGNPSATINFVRKRPTKDFQAKVDLSAGSWDNRRLDADISSPLNADGSVRGRLVAAHQDRNSYLDRYSTKRDVVYGVVEADLTDSTNLAFGHTYQQNNSSGNNFGSLALLYADGSKRDYKVSDSTAPEWSRRNVDTNITFAELTQHFNNDWKVKGQLTHKETTSKGRHNYVYGNEDRATGLGLSSFPVVYDFETEDNVVDIYVNGPFEFAGRKHDLLVGATLSKTSMKEYSRAVSGLGTTVNDDLSSFDAAGDFPLPMFGAETKDSDYQSTTTNIYTAAKLNPTDDLKVTVGGSLLCYELEGIAYGTPQEAKENNKFTPYVGAVYDLNDTHSVYASYTGIYRPQVEIGVDFKALAPLKGKNVEAGVKSEWFNKKLNSSFALFRTEQENQAQAVGTSGTRTIYEGIQATTKGYEFDVSGEVTDNLNVNAGYTRLMSVKGDQDQNVNPFVPRHLVHLTTVYNVPFIQNLKVGASLNWQSDTYVDISTVRYVQDSYATLNLMANYKIDDHWNAAVNLYNVTDEKYLSSLRYSSFGQGYYAAPVSGLATLTWKY
jgi:outer membrane receptor for ferric coprogen and ferric-rhodotorulic acid